MGQSQQSNYGRAAADIAGIQQQKIDILASEFAPGGSQSVDAWWKNIEPYFDKAKMDLTSYAGGQLGALRGSAGSALVESGVASGGPINSAYLSTIAPAIAELSKARAGIETTKGGLLSQLFTQNANIRTGLLSQGWNGVNAMLGAGQLQSSSTPGGDVLGALQALVNIGVPGAALLNPSKYGFFFGGK